MLPVEVFSKNICHNDSLFLTSSGRMSLSQQKVRSRIQQVEWYLYPIILMKAGGGVVLSRRMKTCEFFLRIILVLIIV